MTHAKRTLLDRRLWDFVAISLPTLAGLIFLEQLRPILSLLTTDTSSVFNALVGFHSAILGFVLAALSITASYAQSERFEIVRRSGQLSNLYRIYVAAAVTELVALVVSLVALVTSLPSPFHVALAFAVAGITTLSIIRLARTIWVTSSVVQATASNHSRAAGER